MKAFSISQSVHLGLLVATPLLFETHLLSNRTECARRYLNYICSYVPAAGRNLCLIVLPGINKAFLDGAGLSKRQINDKKRGEKDSQYLQTRAKVAFTRKALLQDFKQDFFFFYSHIEDAIAFLCLTNFEIQHIHSM